MDRTEDDPPCDWAPVRDWFVGWVDDADLIRDSDLARMVASWPGVVTTLKKRIADVKSAAKLVATRRKSTATKVAAVQKKICAKNACKGLKGKSASTFLGNGESLLFPFYTYLPLTWTSCHDSEDHQGPRDHPLGS